MSYTSIAKIISWNSDNEAVCASAAKISTTSGDANAIFEKTNSSTNNSELIQKVLRSGHKSVIEHAVFTVAFWNVSAFVEQFFIECRLASFTVKSRRYVDFSNQGYYIPPDISGERRKCYSEYMDLLFESYQKLLDLGIPREDARFLLPYSFCSNFYCTLNARELTNIIAAIRGGRGKGIPELQDLADQLVEQAVGLIPGLKSEFDKHYCNNTDSVSSILFEQNIALLPSEDVGNVKLVQAPTKPMETLKLVASANGMNIDSPVSLLRLLNSPRPRELEHISYTFKIDNITLSGITHLVRHRLQSIIIPQIQSVDHSKFVFPSTIQNNHQASECYKNTLAAVNSMLRRLSADPILAKYSYYFAISGNMLDVISTMNARELMLFIRLRSCNRAQWEIRSIAENMLELLREDFPELFNSYGPTCVLTGHCPEGRLSCGKIDTVLSNYSIRGKEYE